jgi:hypothetical protein
MLVILSKDIRFKNFDEEWVTLKEGTEAYVDIEESIAYAEGYHFDIIRSEFIVIN